MIRDWCKLAVLSCFSFSQHSLSLTNNTESTQSIFSYTQRETFLRSATFRNILCSCRCSSL